MATSQATLVVLGVLVAALAGCASPPAEPDPRLPLRVEQLGETTVLRDGEVVGKLVRMRIEHPQAKPFWQARDAQGRWLGYIDDQNRVYQRVPFATTEVFRGVQPMEKALALLYERPGPFELAPEAPAAADASAQKGADSSR